MGKMGATTALREEKVLNALGTREILRTHDAARILGVSECTVRRVFDKLQEKSVVVRVHGGVKLYEMGQSNYYFEDLSQRQAEEKRRIGVFASTFVNNGDNIFMDSGTTVQQMAIALADLFRKRELRNVQIFTNSLKNLNILKDLCEITLIGGLFRSKHQSFCGHLAEMLLSSLSFQKCFLGADGINLNQEDGVMTPDAFNAKMNYIVASRAHEVFLLADSTKFTHRSFIRYTTLDTVKIIITDLGLEENLCKKFSNQGPEIYRV